MNMLLNQIIAYNMHGETIKKIHTEITKLKY